jgi:hypothetical protein
MTDLVTTDVFKFVAVRPPQRVSDKETSHTIIRDARASDPAGVRTLAAFAGDLARPEAALARWRELDTSALTLLFEAHRVLLTGYEALRERMRLRTRGIFSRRLAPPRSWPTRRS